MEESVKKNNIKVKIKGIGQYKSILLVIIVSLTFPLVMFQILDYYETHGGEEIVTTKAGTLFQIEKIDNGIVYIRNIGLHDVENFEFYINNIKIQYIGPTYIGVGKVQSFSLNSTQLKSFSYPNFLRVSALGVEHIEQVDFSGL